LAAYLLDTSALVKLYHGESGSAFVEGLFRDSSASLLITPLTLVEFESAIALKVRTGSLQPAAADMARRGLRADLARRRLSLDPRHDLGLCASAHSLMRRFGVTEGLRTLDALQLAAALTLCASGRISAFLTADKRLCRISALAGCPAMNPESPDLIAPR